MYPFLSILLCLAAIQAQGAPKLPAELVAVEAKYTKAGTLRADFTQINEIAALKQKKTSSGILSIKRPSKIRWEEQAPEHTLLVSDGRTLWYYTPPFEAGERGQVIERKAQEAQSRLANALLSGAFSKATKDMKIETTSPTEFTLIPRKGSAGTVIKAILTLNADAKLIEKVVLEHKEGNRSEITLSKIELGKELPDAEFRFTAPPNTDRIKQ